MATTTDIAPQDVRNHASPVASGRDPTNRVRDFEYARRHTRRVRLLRIGLPVFTVVVLASYLFAVLRTAGVGENIAAIALPKILPTDLVMQNPHYEGYAKDGSMYNVRAKAAKPDLKNPNLVDLTAITAELIDTQKKKTVLTATRGRFDNGKSLLVLRDGITVTGESGLKANLKTAVVNSKKSVVHSDDPVDVTLPAGTIRADKMRYLQKSKHLQFMENVKADLNPPEKPKTDTKTVETSSNQIFARSGQPVTITAARLDVFDNDSRAIFEGNVIARQGLAQLRAPELEASYERSEPASGTSASSASTAPGSPSGGKLRRIIAKKGPVVMTQAPNDRVTSQSADFDAINETAVLLGNVVMTSGANRSARADRADLNQKTQTAVLSGNVVVRQDKNILKGRRLEVDQAKATTRLSSPARLGAGRGTISARFVQTGARKKPVQPSTGQTGAFRADPNAPLDITARELIVTDKSKTATFVGDVKARQGGFRIAAAQLKAHYKGSAALGNVSSQSNANPKAATTLTQIQAERNVVITGNDGQKVTGDWANFDVVKGQAVVGGAVVVRQGGNVVQGTRLTINTKTGQTVIETAPRNTVAKPQGGGWVTTNAKKDGQSAAQRNKGRPSAVFYLNDIEKARQGRKKPSGGRSSGSAWQAQTAPR